MKTKATDLRRLKGEEATGYREKDNDPTKFYMKPPCSRFEVGDMVWAKVDPYPWWPGQIFNEALADPCVHNEKIEGYVLVAFFGDDSYGWFNPMKLVPFDCHYVKKSKQSNDPSFVNAVEEAENETRRRVALGLQCRCRNSNFRPRVFEGFLAVDVVGYEPGGVYSIKQTKTARDEFRPLEILSFVQQLALMRRSVLHRSVDQIKIVARVLAYRKAVFEEFDVAYAQAFAASQKYSVKPVEVSNRLAELQAKALLSWPRAIPESSGVRKCSPGPMKGKDQVNRDKYLCKQEEGLDVAKVHNVGKRKVNFPSSSKKVTKMSDSLKLEPSGLKCRKVSFGFVNRALGSGLTLKKAISLGKKSPLEKMHVANAKVDWEQNSTELVNRSLSFGQTQPRCSKAFEHYNGLIKLSAADSNSGDRSFPSKPPKKRLKLEFRSQVEQNSRNSDCLKKTFKGTKKLNNLKSSSAEKKMGILGPEKPRREKKVVSIPAESYRNSLMKLNAPVKGSEVAEVLGKALNDLSFKGLKKPNKLNSLPAAKKNGIQEPAKSQGQDENKKGLGVQIQPNKNSRAKLKAPTRAAPVMLMMQFPRYSTLPSVSELKAKFARFRPLDHSCPRVFWNSSICQIVFNCEYDAHAAYSYAVSTISLFGNKKVDYYLQALDASTSVLPNLGKWHSEVPSLGFGDSLEKKLAAPRQRIPKANVKSCLKRPLGNELLVPSANPLTKLMSGANGDHGGGEQLVVYRNVLTSEGDHLSLSHATINGCSTNSQRVLPLLPHPPDWISNVRELERFVEACNVQHLQCQARNNSICTTTQSADISGPLLNLLARCKDTVTSIVSTPNN
ncbi:hypothetical protein HS088_TW14G01127 [Tripterygium wilfordii]|uniref:PWWP domain-containing protein n=1 Tax=Tripterygium wilfordii TaxID=458696 RepID=A0A7J7CS78_TRIWF|nr:uncharacterized protein LOC120015001 [Tripterygium wilfordii]XP_038723096.1 uncharacterized protein LOC120015001 [Tripterygium wilfordii]XP_038723097.1 uncharacterized protein LOC120015001 [Tripterygium wilfordii]XP_038723098.1 uncharacterized protein LOC120015001 [Tripterygium wilfordii]XP_038723099.1 uncharacterized protein LOC120015001 [Tripterygium wilfordii]XP_038723100.1 uncharacterized protein LOC120015001 [Tripterygium wilfordii]KAF5736972.1 hypothetical protein HS088_TW14G01127 [T